MTRPWLVLALTLLCGAGARADDWEDTRRFWESEGQADALTSRTRAFDRLARASDAKGLPLLQERYKSPRAPHPEEERFLIAGALRWASATPAARQALEGWVRALKGRDPWLESNAMAVLEAAQLLTLVKDPKEEAWRRAAAAQVLAANHLVGEVVPGLSSALAPEALPRKERDLALLAGGFGAALIQLQVRLQNDPDAPGDGELEPLLTALLGVRAHKKLPAPARALLERRLARFSAVRGQLEAEEQALDPDAGGTRLAARKAPASFVGITVQDRERIVYVVDLSDSMLAPLTREESERLREASRPRTGDQGTSPRGGADNQEGAQPALPWDRIRTRFDAARELLLLSLRELEPGTRFAVVVFGDEAALLRSTPRLVEAGAQSLAAVSAEMRAIQPGAASAGRPNGTLRGQTNLHAAVRLAWQVSTKGVLSPAECASWKNPSETLADTVFLLSDGAPTRDDFKGLGPAREHQAGTVTRTDPETGATTTSETEAGVSSQELEGPYRDLEYFQRDLERLNLFRWTQLHVVGLGECDERWGRLLSRLGEGELEIVGGKAGD